VRLQCVHESLLMFTHRPSTRPPRATINNNNGCGGAKAEYFRVFSGDLTRFVEGLVGDVISLLQRSCALD